MTEVLVDPFHGGNHPSDDKLKNYQKQMHQLKSSVIEQDKETTTIQTKKLKDYLQGLQDIKKKAETNRVQCENKIQNLKKQADQYQQKTKNYEITYKNSNKEDDYRHRIASEQEQYVTFTKKRIELANSIDCKKLAKLDIDERKSLAHQIFKWALVTVYNEPENKYYWPNFKEQAIEEDQGVDFKERLGKIGAFQPKQEQKVKTIKFLDAFESIKVAEELKGFQTEVNTIHEIAKLFKSSFEGGKRVKQYEKKIEESRKEFQKGDQQNLQNSKNYNAINERIRVSEAYLKQLRIIQSSIDKKIDRYNIEINEAEKYLSEMQKLNSYSKDFKAGTEQRQQCQCNIY